MGTQQTNQKAADFNKRCDACVNSQLASRFCSCANTRCNRKFAHDGSNLVILKKKKELWRKKQCSQCDRKWHRDENAAKNIFRIFTFTLLYDARPSIRLDTPMYRKKKQPKTKPKIIIQKKQKHNKTNFQRNILITKKNE